MRFVEINYVRYVESEGWVKGKAVAKRAVLCRGELVRRLQSGVHTVAKHITRSFEDFLPSIVLYVYYFQILFT